MNNIFYFFVKASIKVKRIFLQPIWKLRAVILFKAFNVQYSSFKSNGVPIIRVSNGGTISIGGLFKMNNGYHGNLIGRQQPCIFNVSKGTLTIGNNVGISSSAIVCHNQIRIGDNVKLGGNVVIYDTDFHSLNFEDRISIPEVKNNIKTSPVNIGNNVFIGANSTVLKGVSIGENSIIGAGSVVTKNIPANEIWGGNPIVYIKSL